MYTLAFSPCPNDTFMFWAMLHRQVNTQGFTFDVSLKDIEQLNHAATNGVFDMVKISYAMYPKVSGTYQLLTSGSALGFGNGPLLISRRKVYPDEIPYLKIAIPGIHTTANMLLSAAYPLATNKKEYLFSDIEEVVLSNEADAGLLIHETRFTYMQKGLHKIIDLGEYWENETSLPLPLGAIAVRRNLNQDIKSNLNTVLSDSVSFALQHPDMPTSFVASHAQAMDMDVCQKHIKLYVNNFSVDLSETGKHAVDTFFRKGCDDHSFAGITHPVFVDEPIVE